MSDIIEQALHTASDLDLWGITGLIFGLLAVIFLIKENVWTWPFGILYVLVSFVVFIEQRLFGDFLLHIFFLILNIYGWYYWVKGKNKREHHVPITYSTTTNSILQLLVSAVGILFFGYFLAHIEKIFEGIPASSLPYWDATTSVLSITGMWLTAKKKIENWYYWFVVDVLATGIYFYKGIYFYGILYLVYIILAVLGYLNWKKLYQNQ